MDWKFERWIELLVIRLRMKIRKDVGFNTKERFISSCKNPFVVGTLCFLMFIYRLSPLLFYLLVSSFPVFVGTAVLLGALLTWGHPHDDVPVKHGRSKQDRIMHGEVHGGIENHLRKVGFRDLDRHIKRKKKGKTSNTSESNEEVSGVSALRLKLAKNLGSDDKSEAGSFDSEQVNLDSPPQSPWATMMDQNSEDEGGLDSGSESVSSFRDDTSAAEITPMLNELHPLLDEESAIRVQMLFQSSRAASERSALSMTSGHNSDTEAIGEYDDITMDERDDRRKPIIVWTAEDQKNLQDLGSSEIERNQRLECVMEKRRAGKYKSAAPDLNLVNAGLQASSRTRKNPFEEAANDGYDHSGQPRVPGSAPSILRPKRNPFDTPCDSSDEKCDQMGEDLMLSRRRYEKRDVKMKPYFVPESPYLQQSSEMSDSRMSSSVPETTSVSSAEDVDDQRLADEDVTEERTEGKHRKNSSSSSSSSFSGASEMDYNDTEGEVGSKDGFTDDQDVSRRTSARSTVASSPANEVSFKDPVYDCSPPVDNRALASYNSFNLQSQQQPQLDILPALLKKTALLAERNSHGNRKEIRKVGASSVERLPEYLEDKSAGHSDEEKQHPTTSGRESSITPVRIAGASLDSSDREESDDLFHDSNVKISTPAVRDAVFDRMVKNEPSLERLNENLVPSTPVELDKLRAIPNLNIPYIRQLIDTTIHSDSPYTPEASSSASKESGAHSNMQPILEEVGEAKETDDSSEPDSEEHDDDNYWRTHRTAFDQYVDSTEKSYPDGDKINVRENHGSAKDAIPEQEGLVGDKKDNNG